MGAIYAEMGMDADTVNSLLETLPVIGFGLWFPAGGFGFVAGSGAAPGGVGLLIRRAMSTP